MSIKRKLVELENIGFQDGGSEQLLMIRLAATLSIDRTVNGPEALIAIGGCQVSIPLDDLFQGLDYLGIDLESWIGGPPEEHD